MGKTDIKRINKGRKKKIKTKKIIITLVLFIFCVLLGNINSYAAKGSFSLSTSSVSLKKGKSTTISINAKNCEGAFKVTSSNSNIIVLEFDKDGDDKNEQYGSLTLWNNETITIKAVGSGTAKIKVTASDVTSTDGVTPVTGTKTVTVKVPSSSSSSSSSSDKKDSSSSNKKTSSSSSSSSTSSTSSSSKEEKASSDATLKNFGITPSEYDFSGFRRMTTSYSVTVPSDVEEISIYAYPNDSKATVTGTGAKKLTDTENTFSVKVTAEDKKTTKTYTLTVKKQEEEKEDEDEVFEALTNIEITGIELDPMFDKTIFEYNISVPSGTKSLDITTEKANENIEVEIIGNEDLQEGENVITILARAPEKDQTATYQLIATVGNQDMALSIEDTQITTEDNENNNGLLDKKVLIAGIIVVLLIVIIITVVIYKKRSGKKNNFDVDEDINNDNEDRIDLSDHESMFDRINESTEQNKSNRRKRKGNHFKD